MKNSCLLVAFFFMRLTTTIASSSFSVFGSCQQRCITEFGDVEDRVSNTDTVYREVTVDNNTDFSLCRLGCTHPEFSTLNLPEFLYGQSAYREISLNADWKRRENIVDEVRILCLDHSTTSNLTTAKNNEFDGKLLLILDDNVKESLYVHLIEVIARATEDEDEVTINQNWCYNSNCFIKFNGTFFSDIRLRVSSFDDVGMVGRHVLSEWYNIQQILLGASINMQLKNVEWNDDKAAARFELETSTIKQVPACTFQVKYKNALSSEFKRIDFSLDHTKAIIVRQLHFKHNYTFSFVNSGNATTEAVDVRVPSCNYMVNDLSMCAPPPVSTLASTWNKSSINEHSVIIEWTYFSVLDQNINRIDSTVRTSHFQFSVHPLISPDNEKCEKYEPVRRDVYYTNRKVVFNVPDSKCNYEAEVVVFDTKRRKSEKKKIRIIRVNEPSFMALLPSTDIPTTIGLFILVITAIIILFLIILIVLLKRRNRSRKVKKGETVVYAYVDEPTRNVIGVRPPGLRYIPVENINKDLEAALSQQTVGYNNHDGRKGNVFQVLPQPSGETVSEHQYEYIDYNVESELSDEVFEEDICISTPNSSFRRMDSPSFCLMAPIAPFEEFDNLPAYAFQNFRFGKPHEREGNPFCLMTTAVDVARGHCYSLKYPRDYSEPSRRALRRELEILRVLPLHPNLAHFDGVVIGRWESIPYQITGILMEENQGGSLYDYINSAGYVFRRQGMRTPENHQLPIMEESPNLSSGYDSFTSKGRQTPEQKMNHENRSYQQVSSAFCRFTEQVSSALEHLHYANILHTRVTSINIYLSTDYTDPLEISSEQIVKLGDFSNASFYSDDVTIADQNLQPPEVIYGKKYESKGDIWQFGMCMVEMCTLGVPYQIQKNIPMSGISEFDKLETTRLLRDTAKKCLKLRNRPTASDIRSVFADKKTAKLF